MYIDSCDACNFRCKFCAVQTSEITTFKKQSMTWELYQKIIDDLTGFSTPLKMLRFGSKGEPLINQELPKMIAYAQEKKVTDFVEIVTNASLLTPSLSDALIEAGVNRVRISIESVDAKGYEMMCGKKINWDSFLSNIIMNP